MAMVPKTVLTFEKGNYHQPRKVTPMMNFKPKGMEPEIDLKRQILGTVLLGIIRRCSIDALGSFCIRLEK